MSYQPWLCFPWTLSLGHPAHLAEARTPVDISAVYMPSNTTSLFQPMDQRVIATFKAYYLCHTWRELWTGQTKLTRITGTHLTFWRALITSKQLGRKCQRNVRMERGTNSPRIYARLHRISTSGEHYWDISRLELEVELDEVTAEDVTEFLGSHWQQFPMKTWKSWLKN
jgi:hypothetical protein